MPGDKSGCQEQDGESEKEDDYPFPYPVPVVRFPVWRPVQDLRILLCEPYPQQISLLENTQKLAFCMMTETGLHGIKEGYFY